MFIVEFSSGWIAQWSLDPAEKATGGFQMSPDALPMEAVRFKIIGNIDMNYIRPVVQEYLPPGLWPPKRSYYQGLPWIEYRDMLAQIIWCNLPADSCKPLEPVCTPAQ